MIPIIILTLLVPVIMLPINIALFVKDKKHGTVYAFFIAFAMAAIAFNFTPLATQNTDILRHFIHMSHAKNMSFAYAQETDAFASLMGYFTLLKVFSFAENQALLPAFITLIGYFFCLSVLSKIDNGEVKSVRFLALFLFLAAISFLGFCSGIRQYTIFAVFVLLFYMESRSEKKRWWIFVLYLLLMTLHTSMGFIILLRILAELLYRAKRIRLLSCIVLFWGSAEKYVMQFIENNFTGNIYADKILEMSVFYEENPSGFIIPMFAWRFVLLIFCTYVVWYLLKKDQHEGLSRKYLCFALVLCLFTFGSAASYDVFARFSILSFMITLPLFSAFFKELQPKTGGILLLGLLGFGGLVLLYNLSQYLTFHFEDLATILTTNIFTFLGAL